MGLEGLPLLGEALPALGALGVDDRALQTQMVVGEPPVLAALAIGDVLGIGAQARRLQIADPVLPVVEGQLAQRLQLEVVGERLADRLLREGDAAHAEGQEAHRALAGLGARRGLGRGVAVLRVLHAHQAVPVDLARHHHLLEHEVGQDVGQVPVDARTVALIVVVGEGIGAVVPEAVRRTHWAAAVHHVERRPGARAHRVQLQQGGVGVGVVVAGVPPGRRVQVRQVEIEHDPLARVRVHGAKLRHHVHNRARPRAARQAAEDVEGDVGGAVAPLLHVRDDLADAVAEAPRVDGE